MNLNLNERNVLQILIQKIRSNSASPSDYNNYEKLLIKAGFNQNEIRQNLFNYNYTDWENFHIAKKQANSYEQKRILEVVIKGALIGLGLAALMKIVNDD